MYSVIFLTFDIRFLKNYGLFSTRFYFFTNQHIIIILEFFYFYNFR